MENTFGDLLRELRRRAGFGLRRFADMVEMQPSNLSEVETGQRNPPSGPEKLRGIAEALGLVQGTADWVRFFDSARQQGELPADIRHMAGRPLVPALLRTIDSMQLGKEDLQGLIREVQGRPRGGKRQPRRDDRQPGTRRLARRPPEVAS